MGFDELLFFMYIFAGFAGVLAILMVLLLIKYRHSGNQRLLRSIRNFMLCTVLINFIYFYFTYYELKYNENAVTMVVRVLDMCAFIGQVYFWTIYMREKSLFKEDRYKTMNSASFFLIALCVLLAIVSYGSMMDDYYLPKEGINEYLPITIEIIIAVILTFIDLWYLKAALPGVAQKVCRRLMVGITVLLTVNGIWNAILVIGLLLGMLDVFVGYTIDPTPILIFATNIVTILLIKNEDFTALFKAEDHAESTADDLTVRMDDLAEAYFLTEREREIMELAYHKMTNPEIAEKLCISKYTVKNHMHHIFEKLHISTRAELSALIDENDAVN